ncbi:MAG: hypothetical protein QXZ43_04095 [Candidatus Aenigmatarchaeota archaeon]
MENKFIITFIAIIILVALFLASPRGKEFLEKSKLKDKLSVIGNFFKNLTGKVTSVKNNEGSRIQIKLSGVDPAYMNNQQFNLEESEFSISLKAESANLDAMTLSFKANADIYSSSFKGKITYSQDKITLEGKANDIGIDNFVVNKTDISFTITGKPTNYKITNIKKDFISFTEVSGSLTWAGLKTPAMLQKDKLDLYDFSGTIEEKNGLIYIEGTVTYMKLNNVPIGIFK